MSRYVAESITTDAGRFGYIGLCQLCTKLPTTTKQGNPSCLPCRGHWLESVAYQLLEIAPSLIALVHPLASSARVWRLSRSPPMHGGPVRVVVVFFDKPNNCCHCGLNIEVLATQWPYCFDWYHTIHWVLLSCPNSLLSQHFSTCKQLTKILGSKHSALDWSIVVYCSSVNFATSCSSLAPSIFWLLLM